MTTQTPFFSIITVTYNNLQGLIKTKKSIWEQSETDFEWIIIDGNSADHTKEFLSELITNCPFKIQYVSETDNGIYDAMNKGILMSSSKYIVFLNAGDSLNNSNVLQNIKKEIFPIFSDIDIIFGGANLKFQGDRAYYRAPKKINYVKHGLPAIHQATFYKTSILKSNLYHSAYRICGDYYLICVLSLLNIRTYILDIPFVDFEVGGVSFQHPFKLLKESLSIKRSVLHLNYSYIGFSGVKILISYLALFSLNYLSACSHYFSRTK